MTRRPHVSPASSRIPTLFLFHQRFIDKTRIDPITMSDVKVAQPTFGHDNEKLEITHAEHRDAANDDSSFVEKGGNGQPTLDIVYVPGTAEEKALVRKMDRRLLPILWLMYGESARSNSWGKF
jgi:hypothetical protein